MKNTIYTVPLLMLIGLYACSSKQTEEATDVPTTLEQHDSDVKTTSSWSTNSGQSSATSSSSSSSTSGAPTSFSFSTSGNENDSVDLTSIRDIAESKELRDVLEREMIRLLLSDKLIDSEDDKISLTITQEWMMVNKKILDEDQAEKYVELLRSKMSLGSVFNYSFNRN